MFETERFVAECRAAFAEDRTHIAVREVLARSVCNPTAVLKELGEPKRAGIKELFHSDAHHHQRGLGAGDDGHASQSSNVGRHRHLYGPGGQCVLAARERNAKQNRGRWRKGSVRDRRRASGC